MTQPPTAFGNEFTAGSVTTPDGGFIAGDESSVCNQAPMGLGYTIILQINRETFVEKLGPQTGEAVFSTERMRDVDPKGSFNTLQSVKS